MSAVRVAVSSPVAIVRAGLTAMLETDAARVRVVDVPRAGAVRPAEAPQVVLYDALGLQHHDGRDLASLLAQPGTRVLVVSRDLRPDLASRALARGAHGVVPMAVAPVDLLDAVETVGSPDREPGGAVAAQHETEARLGRETGLTPREIEVLTLITRGMSNADIAAETYLSVNSVKTYVRGAYRRIGVHNRSQAVIWCLQHGFAVRPGG